MASVMKIVFFVFTAAFFSVDAFAGSGCTSIDPTVAARLVDFMPAASVDAVIGCAGREGKTTIDWDGSVITSRSYSDYQENKDYQTTPMNTVIVTFRNGLLMQATSASGKADRSGSAVVKSPGYPPRYSTCVNYVCTP